MDLLKLAASSLFSFQGMGGRECARGWARCNVLWVPTAGNSVSNKGLWHQQDTLGCSRSRLSLQSTARCGRDYVRVPAHSSAPEHISPLASSFRLSPSQMSLCKAGPWSGSPGQEELCAAGGAMTMAAVSDQHNHPVAQDLGAQSRDPTAWDTVGKQ